MTVGRRGAARRDDDLVDLGSARRRRPIPPGDVERRGPAVHLALAGVLRLVAAAPTARAVSSSTRTPDSRSRSSTILPGERLVARRAGSGDGRDHRQLVDAETVEPAGGFARDDAAADDRDPARHGVQVGHVARGPRQGVPQPGRVRHPRRRAGGHDDRVPRGERPFRTAGLGHHDLLARRRAARARAPRRCRCRWPTAPGTGRRAGDPSASGR